MLIKPWNLIQSNSKLGPEELPLFAARVRKFAMILRRLLAALEPPAWARLPSHGVLNETLNNGADNGVDPL